MFHSLWGRPLRLKQMAVPCVRFPLPEPDSLLSDSARLSQPPVCGERGKPRNHADFQRNGAFERSGQPNVNRFCPRWAQGPSSPVPVPAMKQQKTPCSHEWLSGLSFKEACWWQEVAETLSFAALRWAGRGKKQTRVCGAAATVRRDVMRYDLWRRNCRRSAMIGLHPCLARTCRAVFINWQQPILGARRKHEDRGSQAGIRIAVYAFGSGVWCAR